ncbi:hypothetical protein HMPREF1991_02428 [Hoylesella loescheii DSM 19665 = JCM 12249 = ATCC 15930]|uniref:Uncharacterized protein n=1 Tax=Hoylesella loescheii DSM 19665 = JCM 12249 = ATCC 15930 TaxID=1122985 RepID=A0A069QNT2_HOYLO|nr:hypothetical protein HMPREF1991_02428 [Hoylesella loescheii DSM 19665 = JCM 12249 = ATCC 15930]
MHAQVYKLTNLTTKKLTNLLAYPLNKDEKTVCIPRLHTYGVG